MTAVADGVRVAAVRGLLPFGRPRRELLLLALDRRRRDPPHRQPRHLAGLDTHVPGRTRSCACASPPTPAWATQAASAASTVPATAGTTTRTSSPGLAVLGDPGARGGSAAGPPCLAHVRPAALVRARAHGVGLHPSSCAFLAGRIAEGLEPRRRLALGDVRARDAHASLAAGTAATCRQPRSASHHSSLAPATALAAGSSRDQRCRRVRGSRVRARRACVRALSGAALDGVRGRRVVRACAPRRVRLGRFRRALARPAAYAANIYRAAITDADCSACTCRSCTGIDRVFVGPLGLLAAPRRSSCCGGEARR